MDEQKKTRWENGTAAGRTLVRTTGSRGLVGNLRSTSWVGKPEGGEEGNRAGHTCKIWSRYHSDAGHDVKSRGGSDKTRLFESA